MGSPTSPTSSTTEQWKQRIECLKSRKRLVRPIGLKEDLKASNLMAPELYMAIRSGSMPDFLSVLEKLCKSVHVSDIVEQVTRGGNTILHLAAKNGKQDILVLMAEHFPQLIIRTNITGDTALHFAARIDDLGLNSLILHWNHNQEKNLLKMKNEFGNTAMHEAVIARNYGAVTSLFEADKDVANYLNNEGKSSLYLAVETRQDDIVDYLLEVVLFKDRERHQGTSPLHAAIMVMSSCGKIKHKHKSLLQDWAIDIGLQSLPPRELIITRRPGAS